ncbi:hypothetical protein AAKU67_004309 [Oxalobacteraceae bacterium GrIS 2.11]
MRHQIGKLKQNTELDFTNTEKLYAEGTLLFLAELKRLIKYTEGNVHLTCKLPINNKSAQVLKQLGILDLLGVKTPIVPLDDDVVNWRCASGHQVLGAKYEDILSSYNGEITPALQQNLYTGITEAMTNVINHAYDLGREDKLNIKSTKDWWMFSQEKDNYLSVVFCDLGAGIPRTLPMKRPGLINRIIRKGIYGDGEIIKYAVKDSVSRTKKKYRGKGLNQIIQTIVEVPGARVLILSNKGAFMQIAGQRPTCMSFDDSILGTLIFWGIPLPSREES